ncbi:hemolysin-type calcium-binding protein [Gluconacetobacter diazotrophicus]|uniref:hemolysin-type calcium-binding protein n=1 Tax=Gluconacetobacter diazotrophicus TaxID=33996 RepID=UPI001199B678|nr:hemolysin-type calcium-binding protein [Gluconacetobacter diazotrophicus]TWB00367.1 hypothetical protein FBZ86_13812 [Gluconacetobacter diazotrophicus]
MTVTATYTENADFYNSPALPANLGLTMFNANGYSGIISLAATDSTYIGGDYNVGGSRYWLGSLWLGGISNPSSSQQVAIDITTDNTDVGLFEFSPSAGSAANFIFFGGNNDSISISNQVETGETMDLSKTTFEQWSRTAGWQTSNVNVIIHGTAGNDYFTGSNQNNYLFEGIGNSIFNQSAGNDIISTNASDGTSNTYYAKDALTSYEGGYVDENNNSYMNNGDDWLLQDTANGKIISLTNVGSVVIGGVTYSASVENSALPWTNASSSSASAADAHTLLASIATGSGLQASTLAESALNALADNSVGTSPVSAQSENLSYSIGGAAALIGAHDSSIGTIVPDDKSSTAALA